MAGCMNRDFDCDCEECQECGSYDDCLTDANMEDWADQVHDEMMCRDEDDDFADEMRAYYGSFDD